MNQQPDYNMIEGPTREEFAQKYNTEIVVMSSPRGEYHTVVVVVHGVPMYLTRLHHTATEAAAEGLRVAQSAWKAQKQVEMQETMREPDPEVVAAMRSDHYATRPPEHNHEPVGHEKPVKRPRRK